MFFLLMNEFLLLPLNILDTSKLFLFHDFQFGNLLLTSVVMGSYMICKFCLWAHVESIFFSWSSAYTLVHRGLPRGSFASVSVRSMWINWFLGFLQWDDVNSVHVLIPRADLGLISHGCLVSVHSPWWASLFTEKIAPSWFLALCSTSRFLLCSRPEMLC